MKVLVTGGAGFIGSNIVRALLSQGHSVLAIDDLSTGRLSNLPEGAHFIEMDIRSPKLPELFEQEKFDFVSHQAARGDVRQSLLRPGEYVDVNIGGGVNLLECCRQNGVKGIAFASSGGCVYGEPLNVPTKEDHPIQPRDPYGATKACFETYLKTYHLLYGLEYTAFRYPNVYGPYQNPFGEAGVVAIFAKAMLEGRDVTINGDGKQVRDYVYIDDVVAANVAALERNANGPLNLGTGVQADVNDIFSHLKDIIGYANNPNYGPAKDGEVTRSCLDSSLAASTWNWKPTTALHDGLAKTVAFIQSSN